MAHEAGRQELRRLAIWRGLDRTELLTELTDSQPDRLSSEKRETSSVATDKRLVSIGFKKGEDGSMSKHDEMLKEQGRGRHSQVVRQQISTHCFNI